MMKRMQACDAKLIIAFHNPSLDPTPSQGDILLTHRLRDAGELLCIELMDHIIIGGERYISLKDAGVLAGQS